MVTRKLDGFLCSLIIQKALSGGWSLVKIFSGRNKGLGILSVWLHGMIFQWHVWSSLSDYCFANWCFRAVFFSHWTSVRSPLDILFKFYGSFDFGFILLLCCFFFLVVEFVSFEQYSLFM